MTPIRLVVNSMQPAASNEPDGPVRLVLVAADKDPKKGQHVALTVYDRTDLDGLAHGVMVDLVLTPTKVEPVSDAILPATHDAH